MLRIWVITEFHINRCFFYFNIQGDLDYILAGLILKACWNYANEKDLSNTYNLISFK